MTHFLEEVNGELIVSGGANIGAAIEEAIDIARREQREVRFRFNETLFVLRGDADMSLISRDWVRARYGIISQVGPDFAELSPKDLERDKRKAAEYDLRQAEYELSLAEDRVRAARRRVRR